MASISPPDLTGKAKDFSSPSMPTAAASLGPSRFSKNGPETPQPETKLISFNESLKHFINRIHGSSVNPYLEANVNKNLGGPGGKNFQKSSLSQVRKVLKLKEFSGEPTGMKFDGKIFKIIEADSSNRPKSII